MNEALVARIRYHIQKANFMGLKEAESTLLLGEAANAIEELSKPRWIPVTERLPEEDGCYLVAVKNDHQRRYSKTAWFSHGSWFARQDVTHWMQLPEPPEEE